MTTPVTSDTYPTQAERRADLWVHAVGLCAVSCAVVMLLGLAGWRGAPGQLSPLLVYGACLVTTFALSAAYNLTRAPGPRRVLRRLDHAAIFLMIAGTYTPFTTQRLSGGWAFWITALVWSAALVGVAGKLFFPGLAKRAWVVVYLAVGWIALIAIRPLLAGVSGLALSLLAAGGAIYSAGVLFYVRQSLRFRRAIWHGFVLAAAGVHYVAVLTGVVLAPTH